MIAICIVTRNNESTIEQCIESIKKINCEIYYTDMDSIDDTKKIMKKYKEIPIVSNRVVDNKNNFIKHIKEDWIFFINPWETLISGQEEIEKLNSKNKNFYKILIYNQEIINKSIRIIKKQSNLYFENPIYEEIYKKDSEVLNVFLKQNLENFEQNEENILEEWIKKNKINPTPYYYKACINLKNKNYKNFMSAADKYLFIEKNINLPSVIMMHYYLSIVNLHVYKNIKKSLEEILICLNENPCMAEFWCVLGDINFYLKKYKKAEYFYENAIEFGKKRKENDEFSIEIKKYKIYPKDMIKKCIELIN